jgi:truncated hemoglobin YjbI
MTIVRVLLPLLLAGCVEVGTAPPPSPPAPGAAPTLTLLSPADGATVEPSATPDLAVALEVSVAGLTLRPPGTCAASEAPCGSIRVRVDGTSCADDDGDVNARAWGNPVLARMALCPLPGGEHRIELELADAAGAPIEGTAVAVDVDVTEPTLLAHLGGEDGVRYHATGWVQLHLLADRNAHGWLHDDRVDLQRVIDCSAELISDVAGGDTPYGTSPLGCPALAAVFGGRGLSGVDFDDALRHLHDALLYHAVDPESADALIQRLDDALRATLVEDPAGTASLYQRLGREEGIFAVVTDFAGRVIADPAVGPFFATLDAPPAYPARTTVCITRLVCAVADGPCGYGHGTEPELEGVPCLDLAASHEHLTAPQGVPDAPHIATDHFAAVAAHLLQALSDGGASPDDVDLVGAALGPTCADIVQVDPEACGG